jgi:ribonuclease HI
VTPGADGDGSQLNLIASLEDPERGLRRSRSGLEDREAVDDALASFKNILAELAGLYHALELVPRPTTSTVVHDYEGIGAWMEGRWETRKPVTGAIVTSCHELVRSKKLKVSFRQQRGHQSSWAGRDDWAYYNQRADACATSADGSTRSGKAWGE